METITGTLFAYFETGTEGVLWSVQDEHYPQSYQGLNVLKKGDQLKIEDPDGQVVFDGIIDLEYESNLEIHPFSNPAWKQQAISGLWVHGVQRGIVPETWMEWFERQYKAVLIPEEPKLHILKEAKES